MEYRKLGRFHINESIAQGGMGEVVKSLDDSGRPIALKTILPTYEMEKNFREMFFQEAEITFQLHHPNIIRAYRFDRLGNKLVLALEYLEGVNLRDILRAIHERQLKVPVPIVVAMIQKVLRGLEYAHNKRNKSGEPLDIVHLDLNPSNIFVTFDGEVKILDFGISKARQKDVHKLTPKDELRGKMGYLSPEQIRGEQVDHRADLFSLGIVVWELLTGQPLYLKQDSAQVMEAIAKGEYQSPSKYRPELGDMLESFFKKALAVSPKHRFASAAEMENTLQSAARNHWLPGIREEEISVFVRSLLQKEQPTSTYFQAGYAWLLTHVASFQEEGFARLEQLAEKYPTSPYVQLNLARAHLISGDKSKGLRLMRRLARVDSLEQPVQEILEWIGVRRPPVISVFKRSHPLNFALGWVRHRIKGPTPYQKEFLAA